MMNLQGRRPPAICSSYCPKTSGIVVFIQPDRETRHVSGGQACREESTMMDRRQFVITGAAGAALFGCMRTARAAVYDLIIKGGRVIDPSMVSDAVRDVAIAQGKIVAVAADIPGDASETIDARGKIVAPGLIDIHTHAGRSAEGPPMCLQDGVTCWVDA